MNESPVKNRVLVSERTKRLISVLIKIEQLFLKLNWYTHRKKFIPDAYKFFFYFGKESKQ